VKPTTVYLAIAAVTANAMAAIHKIHSSIVAVVIVQLALCSPDPFQSLRILPPAPHVNIGAVQDRL
jgi:hypothetical protein